MAWPDTAALLVATSGNASADASDLGDFNDWVSKASTRLSGTLHPEIGSEVPAICVDALGRRCTCGADFMRARDEDAFPVRFFWEMELVETMNTPATRRFRIMITRDITESAHVIVEASSMNEAYEIAITQDVVNNVPRDEWVEDEGASCDAYIADEGGREHEEITGQESRAGSIAALRNINQELSEDVDGLSRDELYDLLIGVREMAADAIRANNNLSK